MRKILLILFIGLAWGHNGQHIPLTPYISAGFKLGDHFEDTAPIFLGKTFGVRHYFQKEKPVIAYKYYDNQISFMLCGIGTGKLINNKGESFKKNKYWIGAFGLLSYEKLHFDDKVEKQYGFFGVLPLPIFQILNN